jgi:hypothetical protein
MPKLKTWAYVGPLAAAGAFALGTYAAFGAVALYGSDASLRLALPGPLWTLILPAAAALSFVLIRRPSPREMAPLWLPAVALLPWLPLPIPPAALLWTGPLARALVLVAIAGVVVARLSGYSPGKGVRLLWRRGFSPAVWWPALSPTLAFALAAALYVGAAWRLAPILPSGDEPHYLVIAESLFRDGDLRIENNHASRRYLAYVDGELKPDYLRRGRDGRIYSIHAPGLPTLVLPAFALGGYRGVVLFLALLCAAGAALAWRAAFEVTRDFTAAWMGWAAVALSAPFFFQAFTVYPDGPAAVIVMGVAYALVREGWLTSAGRLALVGAGLAILPWLHTRYALIAGAAAVVIGLRLLWRRGFRLRSEGSADRRSLWRRLVSPAESLYVGPSFSSGIYGRVRLLLSFLAIPLLSAAAWLLLFQQIYGTFDPRAPYGGSPEMRLARVPIGLTGLLIDQQFGLLPNAPVYLVALGSLVSFARQQRRLAIELLAIAMPYVIAVAAFHMWWAGLSSPARFLVPVLLPMAMPVAAFWNRHATTTPRAFTSTLLAISVGITAVLTCAGDGSLLYNTRDGYARWLDWIAPAANLALALPSLFQGTVASAWSLAAVWLGAIAAGWLALRALERRLAGLSFLAVALVTVAAVSLGAGGGWLTSRSAATEPGSSAFTMLSEACGRTPAFFRVAPFALSATRLDAMAFGVNDAGRRPIVAGGPIWTGRNIPPGRYRLLLDSGLNATGALTIALGKSDAVLQRCDFADHRPGATDCEVDLPAGATRLSMTPDIALRSSVEGLRLQPIVLGTAETCGLRAGHAVVNASGVMYSQPDGVFAEATGLWVLGGRVARLTVQPRGARTLFVRNGPSANVVRVTSGASQQERHLAPGESITVRLYTPRAGRAVPVTVSSEAGFRPADLEAGNRDVRLLGVWVELR